MNDENVAGILLRRPGPPIPVEGFAGVVIHNPRLAEVIDPAASLLCLYERASFCEGTVWDALRGRLVWSDIVGRRVLGWDTDGWVKVVVDNTHFINGNAIDRDGNLVHCEHGRRCISRSGADGCPVPFITHYNGQRFNSPNDITCAPDGTLWFSDPCFGLEMPRQGSLRDQQLGHQSVYRHDPDSGETQRMADFEQPNGLAFSPDGRILYVSDTSQALGGHKHEIQAFDIAPDGTLSDRRLFRVIGPGIPDGFTVDRRGWIWTTSKSGIQIFDADATLLGEVPTPNLCANCELGGDNGRRLFIASEHRLLTIDLR